MNFQMTNRDAFDAPMFVAYASMGLVWVRELGGDEQEPILHGPFMDFDDARDQCDHKGNWIVR